MSFLIRPVYATALACCIMSLVAPERAAIWLLAFPSALSGVAAILVLFSRANPKEVPSSPKETISLILCQSLVTWHLVETGCRSLDEVPELKEILTPFFDENTIDEVLRQLSPPQTSAP